jgi:hypothetical protein
MAAVVMARPPRVVERVEHVERVERKKARERFAGFFNGADF